MVIDDLQLLVDSLCVGRVSREEIEQVGEGWSGGVAVPRTLNPIQTQDKIRRTSPLQLASPYPRSASVFCYRRHCGSRGLG